MKFSELSPSAKDKVREWWCSDCDSDFEYVLEDAAQVASILGLSIDSGCIFYSLGYCQGDHAGFRGRYMFNTNALTKLAEYAPKDEELKAIAEQLMTDFVAARCLGVEFTIQCCERRYSMTTEVVEDVDYDAKLSRQALERLASWIYDRLVAEDEYRRSDESLTEVLADHDFNEDGSII